MSDNTASSSTAPQPDRKQSKQDQIIQAYLTDSEIFLNTASQDPAIRPLLEARGYDEAEFAIGYSRIEAANEAFGERATSMGRKESGTAGRFAAYRKIREDYSAFRLIARAIFPQQGDRVALSLTGDLPEDTGKFVTLATASYTQGKKPPYNEKLTKRGYPAAILDSDLAALRAFTNLASDHEEEKGDAIEDTSQRDSSYDALRAYMKELKGVAKGALRGKHDLLAKLGL